MIHDTYFLKKTVLLAVPVAMQGLLNTVVNLVDNLMIGSLGATAIASVGLANKVFFVFSLLYLAWSVVLAFWQPSTGEIMM